MRQRFDITLDEQIDRHLRQRRINVSRYVEKLIIQDIIKRNGAQDFQSTGSEVSAPMARNLLRKG